MTEPDAGAMSARWTYIAWMEAEAVRNPWKATELRAAATQARAAAARDSQPAHTTRPGAHVSGLTKEQTMRDLMWIKSSRCDNSSGNCVEVAAGENGMTHVRDSKAPETVLTFTRDEWNAFVGGVRDGEFDA